MSPLQWRVRAAAIDLLEGCGPRSNTNRFKVCAAAAIAGMRTIVQLGR